MMVIKLSVQVSIILQLPDWLLTYSCDAGFSFGGTLALSVTASLWKLPLICADVLEKNLCCISLSPPLIELDMIKEVCMESPQISSTLHSIIIKDDFVPRLSMFLDPKNEEIMLEVQDYDPLSSIKVFDCCIDKTYLAIMLLLVL